MFYRDNSSDCDALLLGELDNDSGVDQLSSEIRIGQSLFGCLVRQCREAFELL